MNLRGVALLVACGALTGGPVRSQGKDDIDVLKRQVQALAAGQQAIQKQLEEIRTLLKERPAAAAAAAAPAPPQGPVPGSLVSTAGAPAKGSPSAKVTIVEFSDYQCPYCARFHSNTLPQIQKDYIDSGKVRHVFRSMPLEAIHPQAFKAHEAALCAGDQGKYWPMHDQLFANQRALAQEALVGHAKAVGLDVAAFQQCLSSGKHAGRIREDLADAERLGLNGTPAFLIGVSAPGESKVKTVRFINGARPYADFKSAIDAALASQ